MLHSLVASGEEVAVKAWHIVALLNQLELHITRVGNGGTASLGQGSDQKYGAYHVIFGVSLIKPVTVSAVVKGFGRRPRNRPDPPPPRNARSRVRAAALPPGMLEIRRRQNVLCFSALRCCGARDIKGNAVG